MSIKPNENHQDAIAEDVLTDTNVLEAWDNISVKILPRYESCTVVREYFVYKKFHVLKFRVNIFRTSPICLNIFLHEILK